MKSSTCCVVVRPKAILLLNYACKQRRATRDMKALISVIAFLKWRVILTLMSYAVSTTCTARHSPSHTMPSSYVARYKDTDSYSVR